MPSSLLTILARESTVEEILEAIVRGARTGKISNSKIFRPHPVDEVVRIRTGEIGKAAV